MTIEKLKKLKQADEDLRYVMSVNADYVTGRRDGLKDDETERRAQAAFDSIISKVDLLIDTELARQVPDGEIQAAIVHTEMQIKAYEQAEKMYDSAKHSTKIQRTILAALRQYRKPEPCELCSDGVAFESWPYCPNCGRLLGGDRT